MNIDPLSNHSHIAASFRRHAGFQDGEHAEGMNGRYDQLATERSNAVREAFASLPEIRPEVVERGRQLLADPNYPGPEIVKKIAGLITPLPED